MMRRDIEQLAAMLRSDYTPVAGHIMLSCPNAAISTAHRGRDRRPSFEIAISPSISLCYCFTCKIGGMLPRVFRRLGQQGAIDSGIVEWVVTLEKGDLRSTLMRLGHKQGQEKSSGGGLTQHTITRFVSQCRDSLPDIQRYLDMRGVYEHEISKFQLGFDRQRKRLIFPVERRGEGVVGCVGRTVNGGEPKYYKYPFLRDAFLGEQFIDTTLGEVVLVEGPFDLIKVSRVLPNVICLNGLSIPEQRREWLYHLADEVTFMFDSDHAGQTAIETLGNKLSRRVRVFAAVLPDGLDPGDATESEISDSYANRMIYYV